MEMEVLEKFKKWLFGGKPKKQPKTSIIKGGVKVTIGDTIVYTYITGISEHIQQSFVEGDRLIPIFTYEFPIKRGIVTGISDSYVEIDKVRHPSKEGLEVGHIKIFISEK